MKGIFYTGFRSIFAAVHALVKIVILALIKFYRLAISPVLPAACRYEPTCSVYAMEAVEKHGVGKGGLLALKRLARCHPHKPGGYDPVP